MSNTQNKSLRIGQVIFVLSNKAQKIVPAIVVEEVVVKKLDGNTISWKVSVGPAGKEKIIDSTRLDGEIYTSLEEISGILHKRLAAFLDDLIAEADKRATTWYGDRKRSPEDEEQEDLLAAVKSDKIDPDSLLQDLETPSPVVTSNGTGKFPSSRPPTSNGLSAEEIKRKMDLLSDETVPLGGVDVVGIEEGRTPDGSTVKFNIKV